jgi:hypothetical protein
MIKYTTLNKIPYKVHPVIEGTSHVDIKREIVAELASNPSLLPDLKEIVSNKQLALGFFVLEQLILEATYVELLAYLAEKVTLNRLLGTLASHKLATSEILEYLWNRDIFDPENPIRPDVTVDFKFLLLRNPNTPYHILEEATEASDSTILYVSSNPKLPLELAKKIWFSKTLMSKMGLVENEEFLAWYTETYIGLDYDPSLYTFISYLVKDETKTMFLEGLKGNRSKEV